METENYYSITGFNKINPGNLETHFKECDNLEEAITHKGCSFIIMQRKLPGEDIPGTGLFYPHVYSYKILDKNGKPFFIKYKRVVCTDYIIKTKRMAYYDATADCEVSFSDRNGETASGKLSGVYDSGISFFKGFVNFMIDLEENCSADWNLYRIREGLAEKINTLERELEKSNENITILKEKIKVLRDKLRGKKL